MLRNLIDKIFYGGYHEASRAATVRVVTRYSRGNTSIQLGQYLNQEKTAALIARGDRAASRLKVRVDRATA